MFTEQEIKEKKGGEKAPINLEIESQTLTLLMTSYLFHFTQNTFRLR